MKTAPATVSVVVPVHNGARFIGEALASVKSQTRAVDEIIVVDDGSTDQTGAIVTRDHPDVILLRQDQSGPAAARNAGARRARCDALAFLDHDDLWPPDRTAALLGAWRIRPEADIICGAFRMLVEDGVEIDPRLKRAEARPAPFLFPTLLIRRAFWLAHGGMDGAHDHAEDLDLYLRLVEAGAIIVTIDAVTLLYRQHGKNQSRAVERSSAALLASLRAAVLRRLQ